MANTYKNIVITPNIGNTADPRIQFLGGNTTANTDINLYVYPTSNGTLSFEGSAGQLFSITNDLSNSIFSVNDISGIPAIEVFANGLISIAQFGGNVVIGNTAELILSPGTGIYANGSFGTAGQVLHSNGTAVYWAADDAGVAATTYDLLNVANTTTNQGLIRLRDSNNANDDVVITGANGIVVSSNATAVLLTNQIIAGSGLTGATANTFAVVANSGIVANATGVFVNANSGLVANSLGVFVNGNTGIISNTLGVFVNSSYIATIGSNTANFVSNGTTTNTFTVGTATYFVSNGNVGIGNSAPTTKLSVNGTTFLQANVTLNSALIANGGAGTAGQVLTSNGTATYWAPAAAGVDTAAQYTWTNTHTHASGLTLNNDVPLNFKTVNTSAVATFKQQNDDNFVFYSTNTAYGARAIFSVFANSVTSNLQIHVPLQLNSGFVANSSLGGTGQILFSDGTRPYWGTAPTGGIAPVTNIVTGTSVSAAKDNRYFLTNTSPTTVTLPASPSLGDTVYIVVTNSLANNVVARNGSKIMSLDEDLTLDISYYSIGLTYLDTTRGWIIV